MLTSIIIPAFIPVDTVCLYQSHKYAHIYVLTHRHIIIFTAIFMVNLG